MNKTFVDIGGEVWVNVDAVLVVQPRTQDDDGIRRIPGCAVFLTGSDDPVYGADGATEVVHRFVKAAEEW